MRKAAYVIVVLLYVFCLTRCVQNLDIPTLWFDEAGQFYMGKGLNHFSPPGAPEGTVADVIRNNSLYNMDPGGYGLLLHFWSKISCGHVWLRLLSLSFFLTAVVFVVMIAYRVTRDRLWSAMAGLIPFFVKWNVAAFELRAYSMELAGVVVGLWFVLEIMRRQDYKRIVAASLVLSVFITSRYACMMAVFVDCCFILWVIVRSPLTVRQKWLRVVVFAVPLLATVGACYLLAMRIQNPDAGAMYYLVYLSHDRSVFGSTKVILFSCFAVVMFVTRKKVPQPEWTVFLVAFCTQVLFMGLSFMEMQPYFLWSKRGCMLFVMMIVPMFLSLHRFVGRFRAATAAVVCAGMGASMVNCATSDDYPMLMSPIKLGAYKLYDDLKSIDLSDYTSVYVGGGQAASFRYLYEYGALRDCREVLDSVTILAWGVHAAAADVDERTLRGDVDIVDSILACAPIGSLFIGGDAWEKDTISFRPIPGRLEMFVKRSPYVGPGRSDAVESTGEVVDEVVDVLGAD